MSYIYKICDGNLWNAAQLAGVFTGAEIDLKDGYIHFSTADQLAETLALHFTGRQGLQLLAVDPDYLDAQGLEVKWEAARSGDLFPHLYADLPLAAVVSVTPLLLDQNDSHTLPAQL